MDQRSATAKGRYDDLPPHHLGERVGEKDDAPFVHAWSDATPFLAGTAPVVALGALAIILGTFLAQIWATSADPGDGLAKTASWFVWAGRALVGGALVAAALRPSPAAAGVRIAMVAVGALVLVGLAGMTGATV